MESLLQSYFRTKTYTGIVITFLHMRCDDGDIFSNLNKLSPSKVTVAAAVIAVYRRSVRVWSATQWRLEASALASDLAFALAVMFESIHDVYKGVDFMTKML